MKSENDKSLRIGIIDAANLTMVAWYGVTKGDPAKQEVAAVHVTKMISEIVRENLLDGVVWVREGTPKRRIEESGGTYKAHRPKLKGAPTVDFFEMVWRLLAVLPITCVRHPDHEADDVVAALALDLLRGGHKPIVISGDSDFLQLPEEIKIVKPRSSRKSALPDGIQRGQEFLHYKSLMGDSSDNIPGVRGVGPKGAAKIITEGLDAWLESAPEEKRKAFEDSLSLVTFERVELPLEVRQNGSASWEAMRGLYKEFGSQVATKGWSRWRFSWGRAVKRFDLVKEALRPLLDDSLA